MKCIEVQDLVKEYPVFEKANHSFRLLQSIWGRKRFDKRVVDGLSFAIDRGEFVGYLGPNGAGKSTTLKMLSGVLTPTAGSIKVEGAVPHKQRIEHAKRIGVVFGQRTQLWWDLPLLDSFKLLAKVYDVPRSVEQHNIAQFVELLDLHDFLHTPVRQLSLGQRMRGEIAAALLHNPHILFLDEPTIGLDIVAKEKIQTFLKEINQELNVTVLLTTHNMDDVEKLCDRVILIDSGKIVFNGQTCQLLRSFGEKKRLLIEVSTTFNENEWNGPPFFIHERNSLQFEITENKDIATIVNQVSQLTIIQDIKIMESKIEDVLRSLYLEKETSTRLDMDKKA